MMSPQLAQRYGTRGQGQVRVAQAPAQSGKPAAIPYVVLSAQGSWERDGDKYELQVQDEKGKSETLRAVGMRKADDYRFNLVLVFAKSS